MDFLSSLGERLAGAARSVLAAPQTERTRQLEHFLALVVAAQLARSAFQLGPRGVLKATVGAAISLGKAIPGVSGVIAKEEAKALEDIERDMLGAGDPDAVTALPAKGWSSEAILAKMREWKEKDEAPFREGKCFGGIYHTLEGELEALQGAVYTAYASTNALYPGVFPSVRKYEAELIAMATSLVGGVNARGEPLAGILTSGGTESILLAIKGHRDWAIKEKGIPLGEGEVLCGCTAHGALDKACEYFGLRLIKLPVRATDQRLDPAVVAAHLSRRTVLIYASAPTFPHGVVDPVEELAALAKAHNVGLHVDNCLGGVLLSFMRKAGIPTPKFDFAVDGVTSVSVDLHKYGYCSKGASAVVFRDAHLRHFAFSTVTDWSGGLYVTHTTQGSRSGAIIASSWATLMHIGEEGYLRAARTVHALVQRIVKEIPTMPGLELVTVPDASAVAFTSTRYNIHAFVSELKKRTGWTLAAMQKPAAAQVCVSERLESEIERFLADLRATAAFMSEHTDIRPSGSAGVYGTAAMLPDSKLDEVLRGYCDVVLKVKPVSSAAAGGGGAAGAAAGGGDGK